MKKMERIEKDRVDTGSMKPAVVEMREADGTIKKILRVPLREVFEIFKN